MTKEVMTKEGLHLVIWEIENPRAVVQIAHGMVEHIMRYDAFARYLNKQGFLVVGHDHRGHGKSISEKEGYGVFPQTSLALVEDLDSIYQGVKQAYPNLPYFLLGHSMGSFLVRLYARFYKPELNGLIIMGTGQISPWVSRTAMFLSGGFSVFSGHHYRSKFFHRMTLDKYMKVFSPKRLRADWLSRDRETVNQYMNDDMCQFLPSVGMYHEIFRFTYHACSKKGLSEMAPKTLPILLISGDKDPVGEFGKGVLHLGYLLKMNGYQKVRVRLYRGARHEILNEINKEDVYRDITTWLNNNLS